MGSQSWDLGDMEDGDKSGEAWEGVICRDSLHHLRLRASADSAKAFYPMRQSSATLANFDFHFAQIENIYFNGHVLLHSSKQSK